MNSDHINSEVYSMWKWAVSGTRARWSVTCEKEYYLRVYVPEIENIATIEVGLRELVPFKWDDYGRLDVSGPAGHMVDSLFI